MNEFTQEIWTEFKRAIAEEYPELLPLKLEQSARLSIRLTTSRTSMDDLKIGQTRIGGIPDLPRGMEWPRWQCEPRTAEENRGKSKKPDHPRPLNFIAQIDLSSLSLVDTDLPKSGWLYFFYDIESGTWGYDPNDKGSSQVLYANSLLEELTRTTPPNDSHPDHSSHACRVTGHTEITLPDFNIYSIDYESPLYNTYSEVSTALTDNDSSVSHRLLGFAETIQNPMELECQLVSNGLYCGNSTGYNDPRANELSAGAADWRLLLQIDTDEDGPGWMWGDVGKIYFWIKQQDLNLCRYENTWLILQCH